MAIPASVNINKVFEVARALRGLTLRRHDAYDRRFYPPRDMDLETVVNYYMAMVAIDHRTNIGDTPFTREFSDGRYTGSDLLWRLGIEMLNRDPGFFSPGRLSRIDPLIVRDWLVGDYGPIWDYGVRAYLLRDLGIKVLRFLGTSVKILGMGVDEIINLLSNITAYEDPVRKKAYLLIKFLTARGLLKPDPGELRLPIDNHLTRITYRLGMVSLDQRVLDLVRNGVEVGRELDAILRLTVRDSWDAVIRLGKLDPVALDDFLWSLGRTVCLRDKPNCDKCPLKNVCEAHARGTFINEHTHNITYYY